MRILAPQLFGGPDAEVLPELVEAEAEDLVVRRVSARYPEVGIVGVIKLHLDDCRTFVLVESRIEELAVEPRANVKRGLAPFDRVYLSL